MLATESTGLMRVNFVSMNKLLYNKLIEPIKA